jgi:hypothetical protein
LTAVDAMLRSHGFAVYDLARLPIHHGQLRIFAGRINEHEPSAAVSALKSAERERGMTNFETYRAFAADVRAIKENLSATLAELQAAGKRVVAYGAPAKGSTLLSYLELGPDRIEYIADKSPLKQGRVTPGSHIPIVPAERLLEDAPDYTLLLAWNFVDEILEEQAEYRRRGGKFITPVPVTRIL